MRLCQRRGREQQGGWEPCCALGLWLEIKQPSLAPEWLGYAGAWIPGKTLSLPLAGSGSPCLGYSLFPPSCALQQGCTELALLHTWREPSKRVAGAGWLPCLAAGKLNIYVWPQIRVRCNRQHHCGMGERSCLAVPEEGRGGDGVRGTGRQRRPLAGQHGWDMAQHGMAGNPQPVLPPFLSLGHF